MKNLLNQDLVCGGTSGEWVLPSGEWVLGSAEWTLKLRIRRLLRRLLRLRKLMAVAAWRGAGLGLALTFVEAAIRVPFLLELKIPVPLQLAIVSTAFNMALGMALALLTAPLLQLRRGKLWHGLTMISVLAILLMAVEGPLMLNTGWHTAGGLAITYLAGVGLSRWRRVGRLRVGVLGVLGVAAALTAPYALMANIPRNLGIPASGEAPEGAPNVLFIVLDTLRADRLDVMGYERKTFPWLTEFAREGAVFERALSAAPWTVPSHASMFTGLYPSGHGAHHENLRLDENQTTLAELLQARGWETVALSSNPWVSRNHGLTQGFKTEVPVWLELLGTNLTLAYRIAWQLGLAGQDLSGRQVTESWLEWLRGWDGKHPFFAFLNYAEPHFPYHVLPREYLTAYSPPGTSRRELFGASKAVMAAEKQFQRVDPETREHVSDLYDASVRYEGGLVSRSIDALRQRGVLDDTIVVLVSDHGDLLGEHGGLFQHTRSLVDYLLWVPLIIRYPDRVPAGQRIQEPVTTAAIMPTILDLAGLPSPEKIHTRSFSPLFEGNAEAARSPLLAENFKDHRLKPAPGSPSRGAFDRLDVRYRSFEKDGWKLIVDSTGKRWLFRPVDDPSESRDLAAEHPEIVEELLEDLKAVTNAYKLGALDDESRSAVPVPEIDAATRKSLESLGYLGG